MIAGNKVMVFAKEHCPYCQMTKQTLDAGQVDFSYIDLDLIANGQALHEDLKAHSGQRTVPNIYIDGQHVGGNSDLQQGLEKGDIQDMLENAGVKHSFD